MSDKKSVWIIGYGGLGQAISDLFLTEGYDVTVISRQSLTLDSMQAIQCQTDDDQAVAQCVQAHPLPDAVIVTTGVLHDGDHSPEKTINEFHDDWLLTNIHANVLPSVLFAKHLSKSLKPSSKLTMACFSARVGSINDNQLGGWYSYRMSKAMLNMFIKNLSIEWSMKYKQCLVYGYHPGTVDTQLSKPFQSHVPEKQLFTTEQAANYFFETFQAISHDKHGKVIDWQGKLIEA